MKTHRQAAQAATRALDRARQARDQLKPVAARAQPIARSTRAAATRGVHRTRAWAAPRVERTGRVLRDNVAPRVAALLSGVAQRIEPASSRRGRWRQPPGMSKLAAGASAAAAALRRTKPKVTTSADTDDLA